MRTSHTRTSSRKAFPRRGGKERITISLSKDKVRFLKAQRGRVGASSVSALVERLVAEAQARAELAKLSADTALYYDGLSHAEAEEQRAWGDVGEWGLAAAEE
jgi:hypothetical protein